MVRKKKFQNFYDFGSKQAFTGQIWSERRNLDFFTIQLNKRHSAVPIWSERRKMNFFRFQLNKQLFAGQIWCGRRKIRKFLDLVMKLPVSVPIWSRKGNFFSEMEANAVSCPYMV